MKCRYFCRLPLDISPVYLTRGISNRCFGGWIFMRQNKIQWPYGGFEITYFRAAVSFSTMLMRSGGRYIGGYRHVNFRHS